MPIYGCRSFRNRKIRIAESVVSPYGAAWFVAFQQSSKKSRIALFYVFFFIMYCDPFCTQIDMLYRVFHGTKKRRESFPFRIMFSAETNSLSSYAKGFYSMLTALKGKSRFRLTLFACPIFHGSFKEYHLFRLCIFSKCLIRGSHLHPDLQSHEDL